MASPQYDVAALRDFSRDLLAAAGAGDADAELVAHSLVDADRAGIFSHGLLRLPLYLRAMEAGGIDAPARPRVVRVHGAVTVLVAGSTFVKDALTLSVSG